MGPARPPFRATRPGTTNSVTMWNEPYLETCCRSALHRLTLVGAPGRPDGLKDGPCLARLRAMGLARQRADGRCPPWTLPPRARRPLEPGGYRRRGDPRWGSPRLR